MQADQYLAARAEYVRIVAILNKQGEMFEKLGEAIRRNPGRVSFKNLEGNPPTAMAAPGGPVVDASTWPSPAQMNALLVDFHAAKAALRDVWTSIPAKLREGLAPPPAGVL
jgi:hypothetical protein